MTDNICSNPGLGLPASPVERMYFAWNAALSRNDAAALLALYAPDAVLESPLVPRLLGTKSGCCTAAMSCGHYSICSPTESRRCGNISVQGISQMASA